MQIEKTSVILPLRTPVNVVIAFKILVFISHILKNLNIFSDFYPNYKNSMFTIIYF